MPLWNASIAIADNKKCKNENYHRHEHIFIQRQKTIDAKVVFLDRKELENNIFSTRFRLGADS